MLNLDPIWTPDIQQAHFRLLLDAMARPGLCKPVTTLPESGPVVLAILATLLDGEVSLSDPDKLLRDEDWLMLQVKTAPVEHANYILCDGKHAPDFIPSLGTLPSPDQSATLILVVDAIGDIQGAGDTQLRLSGPGIAHSNRICIKGLHQQWLDKREGWVGAFPLGVDFILLDNRQMLALPRTTKVEII
ncbi:MAG: alpha-D-ribose 1-methylphosphonate 5-triphosphate synthase subunit PhnH [Oleiphilaceae bacterium]|jgi:alpha-D-ribose 1-methylphosphonate 5-triphosphate synthase subunit PhnH